MLFSPTPKKQKLTSSVAMKIMTLKLTQKHIIFTWTDSKAKHLCSFQIFMTHHKGHVKNFNCLSSSLWLAHSLTHRIKIWKEMHFSSLQLVMMVFWKVTVLQITLLTDNVVVAANFCLLDVFYGIWSWQAKRSFTLWNWGKALASKKHFCWALVTL